MLRTGFVLSRGILLLALFSAMKIGDTVAPSKQFSDETAPFVVVLGVAQDGGVPHAGCEKACCREAWADANLRRRVSCLAIVDPSSGERWMIEATPDFAAQLHLLDQITADSTREALQGILLTHGHIGHYSGLMQLGREVMGTRQVPVYAMPRMFDFLSRNGPWEQLVRLQNVTLQAMSDGIPMALNQRITVIPFLVPHRDEYTETAGFRIVGPQRSALFIPDIDKWEKWDKRIEDLIASADVAFLDGTFYAEGEIPGRDMSEIPHPFIVESIRRFSALPAAERAKVRFIHLNHTNPALRAKSAAVQEIIKSGFHVAQEGERFEL